MRSRNPIIVFAAILTIVSLSAAASKNHVISQLEKKFSLTRLNAAKGDTIFFKNEDAFTHTLYSRRARPRSTRAS